MAPFATFCFTAENKKVVAIPPRTTIGQRNDDKGGLKLLYKFRIAAFRKLSRSVTFSWKGVLKEDKHSGRLSRERTQVRFDVKIKCDVVWGWWNEEI